VGDFDQLAPAALALIGVPLSEGDLEVLRALALAFEPSIEALDGADLAQLPLEGDLDPSRPPRGSGV
jgi:hypothetical protein